MAEKDTRANNVSGDKSGDKKISIPIGGRPHACLRRRHREAPVAGASGRSGVDLEDHRTEHGASATAHVIRIANYLNSCP